MNHLCQKQGNEAQVGRCVHVEESFGAVQINELTQLTILSVIHLLFHTGVN